MNKLFFLILISVNIYGYEAFMSAKDLKTVLYDKALVIIDVSRSYKKSHIIGAQSLNVDTLTNKEHNNQLIDKNDLEDIFRDLGINSSSNVVIYGRNTQKDLKNSAFLAYVLISNGFENVSILDGGYMSWVFKYDLFTTIKKQDTDEGTITLKNKNLSVGYGSVKNDKNRLIIDTRYPQNYYGIAQKKANKYLGHIPKAKNSYYDYKFLRDKRIRSKKELNEFYLDGLNISDAKEIVIYGDDPKEAAVEWYIIYKHLGYKNAKIYYNSFKEYVELGLKTERFKWE